MNAFAYEGHPMSSDNYPHKTKPISLGCLAIPITFYLENREWNHLLKYFPCCNHNGCQATKEHKVKGHGWDTTCGIRTQISTKLQTPF